jgi:23S rRNA (adenine1618-N6)-methyltransferase
MADNFKQHITEKVNMHPRNLHRQGYDFERLINTLPELALFVSANLYQNLTIDFKNPEAVIMLNKALLKQYYDINHWDIPQGYLCPPIPGRADYIHYMADVLAASNNDNLPLGKAVKVLDIGVGANVIYPLIGNKAYSWNFVGSEVENRAIKSARTIIQANGMAKAIDIRKQDNSGAIFNGIIKPGEQFDLTICNPPFHSSLKDAAQGTGRKWKNLGQEETTAPNFGGSGVELWCEGGEARFLNRMISESAQIKQSVLWFSSLISKKETLAGCYKSLDYFGAKEIKTIPMSQGQKISRILAWTFQDKTQQQQWFHLKQTKA